MTAAMAKVWEGGAVAAVHRDTRNILLCKVASEQKAVREDQSFFLKQQQSRDIRRRAKTQMCMALSGLEIITGAVGSESLEPQKDG